MTPKILFLFFACAVFSFCSAQGVQLDSTFGTDGITITAITPEHDKPQTLLQQTDGKILVLTETLYEKVGYILRYMEDGSPDFSFGDDGMVTVPDLYMYSAALQSTGKIVLAGSDFYDFILLRFNTDGSTDSTFGVAGRVTTDHSVSQDYWRSVVIQDDDKIITSGDSDGKFAIARYNSNGSPDSSFASTGLIISASDDDLKGVCSVIQNDGKILTGCSDDYLGDNFILCRYNTDGTPDSTFGESGIVNTDINSSGDHLISIVLQPDGKILAVGNYDISFPTNYYPVIVRYLEDGSLDNTFSYDGIMSGDDLEGTFFYDVMPQPDGKILACGTGEGGSGVFRFTEGGVFDITFGYDGYPGRIITPVLGYSTAYQLLLTDDDKFLTAGNASLSGDTKDIYLARYCAKPDEVKDIPNENNKLLIFPNPLSGNELHITADENLLNAHWEIKDITGKLICSGILDGDVVHIPAELPVVQQAYMLIVKTDKNVYTVSFSHM